VKAGLNWLVGFGISHNVVDGHWFGVNLTFVCNGREKTMPPGFVVTVIGNLAPFLALVGATPGIGWRRACRAAGIGIAIFFLWHVIQLSALLIAGVATSLTGPTGLARLLATISVVLPFAVWLLLTRPPFIFQYFSGTQGEENARQK